MSTIAILARMLAAATTNSKTNEIKNSLLARWLLDLPHLIDDTHGLPSFDNVETNNLVLLHNLADPIY